MMTYGETYDFAIAKNWWGINEMQLCLGFAKTHMVRVFVFEVKLL